MIKYDMHVHFDFFPSQKTIMNYYNNNKIFSIFATLSPEVFLKYKNRSIETEYIKLSLGAHPCYLDRFTFTENIFERALELTKYVSEVGLDFTKNYLNNRDEQMKVFDFVCSKTKNKLLVIHSRKADKELFDILNKYNNKFFVMHWYTGTIEYLKKFVNLGGYFSLNEKMIRSKRVKNYVQIIPINRLLIETDAPFTLDNDDDFDYDILYNEIIKYLCDIHDKEPNDIKNILSYNFYNLIVDVDNANKG